MAYTTNNDKMLEAVLMNPDLMKFGQYTAADITNIYQAIESENCVISAVAQIIKRSSEDANADVIYKEVAKYLKENV